MSMMEFAAKVLASVEDGRIEKPACGRWADRMLAETAERFASLAPALDQLPEDMRERYFELLTEVTDAMPVGHVVLVSRQVHKSLLRHAPERLRDEIRAKIDQHTPPPWQI